MSDFPFVFQMNDLRYTTTTTFTIKVLRFGELLGEQVNCGVT